MCLAQTAEAGECPVVEQRCGLCSMCWAWDGLWFRKGIRPLQGFLDECVSCVSSCVLVPRLALLCLVLLSNHCYFICEQPRQSLLFEHPRWKWLEQNVAYAPCLCFCIHACNLQCMLSLGLQEPVLAHALRLPLSQATAVQKQLAACFEIGYGEAGQE